MEDFRAVVSLDDAFDCYEMSKRNVTKTPSYYYDTDTSEFKKIKSTMPWYSEKPPIKDSGIVFINSYALCSSIIDNYLNQSQMSEYKKTFAKESKNSKNKIVSFLWFFERIDGCRDFNHYEMLHVAKALKEWCKLNNLAYLESRVYVPRNY